MKKMYNRIMTQTYLVQRLLLLLDLGLGVIGNVVVVDCGVFIIRPIRFLHREPLAEGFEPAKFNTLAAES